MKVKVALYSEKSMGAPLRALIDSVIGEADNYEGISDLINTALNTASAFIPNQEVITMVNTMRISRYLDIVNLQTYLRTLGIVLQVTEISMDPVVSNTDMPLIEVISPNLGMLPSSTTFYSEEGNYDIIGIVGSIVEKYNLGDLNLVPQSNITSMISAYQDMKSKGMPIFPMYTDMLQNALADYGFIMLYVYPL